MKKHFLAILLVCILGLNLVAQAETLDFRSIYAEMSIEELKSTEEVLKQVLNEKIIGSATLSFPEMEISLAVKKSKTVKPQCDGREINSKTKFTYESSNEEVATVSKGVITAKGKGSAVITVKAVFEDGGELTADIKVNVFVPVSGLKASSSKEKVLMGQTLNIAEMVTVSPEDASNPALRFEVDDESIATINEKGILTPKAGGTAKVTAISMEDVEKPHSTSIVVTVDEPVGSVRLEESFEIGKGKTHTVESIVEPESASSKKLIWESADVKIAKVSEKGTVTGVGTGTTTITATAADGSGCSDSVKVTVITQVSSLSTKEKEICLTLGNTKLATVEVKPADASNKKVKWSSDNPAIASVDENGTITAKRVGTATITAVSTDGSDKKASFTVYVEPKNPVIVTSIFWRTVWGMKNGCMGVEAESSCVHRSIKSFDYTVQCTGYGGTRTEYLSYDGSTIRPGKTGKSKLTKSVVSGFSTAYKVEITVTKVYYTDGSSESIPKNEQYTSTFGM